ncbi:MAG: intermembrane phospholipid transport protein YdbH family protein [Caulobacteraceae bacterium]
MSGEGARRPRGIASRLAVAAGAILVLLLVAGVVLYLARLDLVRRAALAWIRSQGVEGEVQFLAIEPTRLKAKVRLGPHDRPDLTVDEADIGYSLESFLRGEGLKVSSVRLNRPVLNATWHDGKLGLGSIDRLLGALRPQPGAPAQPLPRIEVRSGLVRLQTDYGAADISADADLDQGRLDRLDASLAPVALRLGKAEAQIRSAVVRASRSGDRLRLGVQARIPRLGSAQGQASDADLNLQADLSYAALSKGRIEGRAAGQTTVASAGMGSLAVNGLKLDVQASDLAAAPGAVAGRFHLRAAAAKLRQADLRLDGLVSEGSGRLTLDKAGVAADFAGGLTGAGAWPAMGAVQKDDAPVMAAMKRGLDRFHFAVGKAALSLNHGRLSGRLLAPARVATASGGTLDLKPAGPGYAVALAGGGLPEARADIGEVAFASDGGVTARVGVTAALSLGLLDHAKVKADGRLTLRGGAVAFTAANCADVTVARLDFGDNSAEAFAAKLCPVAEPMLKLASGAWSLAGQARDASAKVPSFEVGLSDGSGAMRLQGRGKDLDASFTVDQVTVTDRARPLRFYPVAAAGRATLAKDLFSGGADVMTLKGLALAHAEFRDQVAAMKGGMTISAPAMAFAKGGLQPTQLSPLTAALGEPASGKVAFEGRFDWTGPKTISSGRLAVDGLSFRSPAGPVTGLSGAMAFTSLAPLVGASVGPFKADRIAGIVPLTEVSALAKVENETATVTDGQGSIGGGRVRVNATASLAADQTVQGRVALEGVQVHDLVASSPFSDKVSLTAQISGALPFRMAAGKLRIAGGAASADGPGRLSINRATFNPGGAPSGPATRDNLSTFGYQAMENLAFQSLNATIDSQPDGKLRMVFHIAGKYDPPARKELRLSWRDILDHNVLNKPMPLPSNTGVNLTLDATLNLDNLIESRSALERQLGSASVQPQDATLGVDTAKGPQ